MLGSMAACTTGTRRAKARSRASMSPILRDGTSSVASTATNAGSLALWENGVTGVHARRINGHYACPRGVWSARAAALLPRALARSCSAEGA